MGLPKLRLIMIAVSHKGDDTP